MGRPRLNKTKFLLHLAPKTLEDIRNFARDANSNVSELVDLVLAQWIKKHTRPERKG